MTITLDSLAFLTSEAGARVLSRLADDDLSDERTLPLITSLRRDLSVEQAGAALELARLRKKAVSKFGDDASKLYFTREALEQASDPLIRNMRAQSFQRVGSVVDACCGIGADALAFADAGCAVTGLDIDPLRVAMARLNADVLGLSAQFEIADVRDGVPDADLVFFDPARRDEQGKRIFDVERYQPPLSTVRAWRANRIVVKLSPGVDLAQLKPYGSSVNFISVDGELKEAGLVIGADVRQDFYCAVLLRREPPMQVNWCDYVDHQKTAPISEPRGWLLEPDPSIIRAGWVAHLALRLGGAMLDPEIAYVTTDAKPETPWARAWRILDWMPFNLKALRAYLRERNVGTVTVKKRGTAVTPETVIAGLKLKGTESRTLVLTRCRDEQIAMVCEDIAAG